VPKLFDRYWKFAITATPPATIVTAHSVLVAVPLGQLVQSIKPVPFAVSKTEEPTGNCALHVPGQLMPLGRLVTLPADPTTPTFNVAIVP
jgi:hypothetical protein